jgi:hypothetical protein
MIGATFCSGIWAPEVAAPWVDWRLASEIEPFPRAVLEKDDSHQLFNKIECKQPVGCYQHADRPNRNGSTEDHVMADRQLAPVGAFRQPSPHRPDGLTGFVRDITGRRNGRLVAIECVGRNAEGRALWRCRCDCGNYKIVQGNNLTRRAGTKSCGCLRSDANAQKRKRDGVWNDGKSYVIGGGERCYKTRQSWANAAVRLYGNKCERCGWAEARCDVHHRIPKARGGLHTLANAVVLCPNCHRIEHEAGNGD